MVIAWLLVTALLQVPAPVGVLMQTSLGDIYIEVDAAHAPNTAANFLKYVDAGLYDGGRFHRTVRPENQRDKPIKIAVVQGAADRTSEASFLPPIALERTSITGLAHKDGTVSMARGGVDKATHKFFICIGDQPELGRVVRGMDVVRRIQAAHAVGETLDPPVTIVKVRRVLPL